MKGTNRYTFFKYLFTALCAVMVLCAGIFVGCDKPDDDTPDEPTEAASVTIDRKTLTISEWESAILTAKKTGTDEEIKWSSDNASVATVTDGKVVAVSCGETTITASAGQASDKCLVTVVPSEVEPTVIINEIQGKDEKLIISDNSEFDLTASVLWNAEKIEGAEISWFSTDETIASVKAEGNTATVKGVSEGETTIKVLAEIRGKTAVYEFKVKVNAEAALLKVNNEGYTPYSGGYKITVNAVEEIEGDGSNVSVPEVYATYKGQKIENISLSWTTENEDMIELDAVTGKITAKQAGSAVVFGVWHYDATDKDYTIKLTVEIGRVTVVSDELREIVINRPSTAATLTLADETVQSFGVDDKNYEDGFTEENGVATFDNSKFDVSDQRKVISVKVVTNKRVYEFSAKSYYAISNIDEWKAVWNAKTAPAIFAKASVVIIEEDIDVSSYKHDGNIVFTGSFSGIFDGQGHTINGATASWFGMFNSVSEEGVLKNVAFVGATLLKDAKLFHTSMNGTLENFYFEGTHRADLAINAVPAFALKLGRNAVIRNVVLNIRGRKTNAAISGVKALFNELDSGEGMPSVNNFYAAIDSSDGSASKDDSVNKNINLYSSMTEMRESVTALPSGFTSDIWQLYDGMVTFKSSEALIGEYLSENSLTVDSVSYVMQLTDITLSADKACEWAIEGLPSSAYSLAGDVLRLNESSTEGETFNIIGYYTEERFGHVYEDRIENVQIKRYTVTKDVEESYVVGLNRDTATYAYTLGSGDPILSVTVNNAVIAEENYSLSGNVLTLKASAFTKTGIAEIAIETKEVIYRASAEVFDMAIGTLDEFKAFWNTSVMTGTVTLKVALTDNIDASGYDNGGNIAVPDFAGVLDGRGYTINGVRAGWNGLFYNLTAEGVVKNVAFTDIRFVTKSIIFGYKLEGTVENCYFEGTREVERTGSAGATNLLASQIGANAVLKNVVVHADNRPDSCSAKSGVFGFVIGSAIMNVAPSGVYVINTLSNGKICDDENPIGLSGIVLYASVSEFKAAVKALPEGFSSEIWQIYEEVLTFRSSQEIIDDYLAGIELTVDSISSVTQLTDISLSADKACEWSIEGLDSSAYTIENGVLRLNENATAGTRFTIVARYTEPRYGRVYEERIENVVVEKYVVTKKLAEEHVIGLNRTGATYSFKLDSDDAITSVTVNNAEIGAENYSLSGNVLTINAAAFTKIGVAEIVIKANGYTYTATAEVFDMAIGTLDEFKAFWSKDNLAGKTVTTRVALTADIDAAGYDNGGNISGCNFAGVFDGRGYTVSNVRACWNGLFYNLTATGVVKNVAFTGIRFVNDSIIFANKLEGTVENCYFEGHTVEKAGAGATTLLANQIGANAVLKNIVIFADNRPANCSTKNGVFNTVMDKATMATAPSGVYVINTNSNGNICNADSIGDTDVGDIHLYSSLADFKAENASRPDDISEKFWNLINGLS